MRLIQAECTVRYTGRCETFFSPATRLIVIKDDGSVMLHVDSGIKPLNYMKASKELGFIEQAGHLVLHASNNKEALFIEMLEIFADIKLDFPDSEREIIKTGSEDLLQEAIFRDFPKLIPGYSAVCREFETGKGPVDVLEIADDGSGVALVEAKRHAHRKDIYQVLKYEDAMASMVDNALAQGTTAIEAKRKGDNDGTGTMIKVTAFANRKLFLAARKFAGGTEAEASEHGVGIIGMPEEETGKGTIRGTFLPSMPKGAMSVLSTRQLGKDETAIVVNTVRDLLVDSGSKYYPEFANWYDNQIVGDVLADKREILYCEAHDTGKICAAAILKKHGEKKICSLFVSENYRHRGIGTALVREAERRLSCDNPMITVPQEEIAFMRPFLEKLGFRISSTCENYYRSGVREYVFNGFLPAKTKIAPNEEASATNSSGVCPTVSDEIQHSNALDEEKILFVSIKPQYGEEILNGTKLVEYRKIAPRALCNKMILYESKPIGTVVGECSILKIETMDIERAWSETGQFGGIEEEVFREYFSGREECVCIFIGSPVRYAVPRHFTDYGLSRPPISFSYVPKNILQEVQDS